MQAHIYMLRKGQRDNPTKRHLELLASFFRVSPAYFPGETEAEQLDLLAAFRNGDVRRLAGRASGLSPASPPGLLQMVDAVRAIEGLPMAAEIELATERSGGDNDPGRRRDASR